MASEKVRLRATSIQVRARVSDKHPPMEIAIMYHSNTTPPASRRLLAGTGARFIGLTAAFLILGPCAASDQPVVRSNPPKDAYFGEQHLHTAYSLDAYIGGARLTPSDAYRFAKGEEVEVNGVKLRISAPLDWAAVTDHAEYIGEMYSTMNEGAPGYDQEQVQQLRSLKTLEEREGWFLEYVVKSNRGTTPAAPALLRRPRNRGGRLEADPSRRRGAQRAGQVHHHPRLRVERSAERGQPPPQRLLPRHQGAGAAHELHRYQPRGRALEVARGPGRTRDAGHRHPAQLQCQQGHDVPRERCGG